MVDYLTGGIVLFAIMVAAGIVPLIMAVTVKVRSLRILALLLGLFAVVHGFYHLASGFQQPFLADVIFEPISLILLVGLGAYYSKVALAQTTDIIEAFEIFSLVLILAAFVIFARLAIKGKSLGSFRFQLSIFLLIWVLSEIPHIGETLGLVSTASYSDIGLYLHATSMAVFAVFVGWRSLKFIAIHPPPSTGAVSVPTEPAKRLKGWME